MPPCLQAMMTVGEWKDIPILPTLSSKWRAGEVRELFALLREEYKNSKRLTIFKRYKELERIISMFTSEQVLQKLLYLTRGKMEEDIKALGQRKSVGSTTEKPLVNTEPIPEDSDDVFIQPDNPSTENDISRTHSALLGKIMTSISSRVRNRLNLSLRVEGDMSSTSSVPVSSCSSPADGPIMFNFNNGPSRRNSTSTTHLTPSDSNTPTSQMSAFHFSPYSSVMGSTSSPRPGSRAEVLSLNSSSLRLSNSYTKLSKNRSCAESSQPSTPKLSHRRTRMDHHMVRSDQIPAFQIPPQRKSGNRRVGNKGAQGGSTPSSPRIRRESHDELRKNVSFLDIVDRLYPTIGGNAPLEFINLPKHNIRPTSHSDLQKTSTQRSESEHLCLISPRRYDENDIYTSEMRRKISVCATEMEELNILIAYERMIQLKTDFETLKGKNILTRYKMMKSFLKSCMQMKI